MNPSLGNPSSGNIVEQFRRDEQRVLDRLVDGELPPSERRQLLAALDDEPGAWRRCALSFLESQTWRGQLAQLLAETNPAVSVSQASVVQPRLLPASRPLWATAAAIAAGLLLAFGLGTRFPIGGLSSNQSTTTIAGLNVDHDQAAAPGATGLSSSAHSTEQAGATSPADLDADETDEALWQTVTLVPADGSDGQAIQLPVVKDATSDEGWAAAERAAMPTSLFRELEQAGLQVTRQARLWPVELADGRRLIVPVEEVDVRDPEMIQY